MSAVLHTSSLQWPQAIPIAGERILAGNPAASTHVMFSDGRIELGLWRVSPGEFTTVHDGYEEFIHIAEGEGELIHDDGTVIPLRPGTVLLLEDGWRGRWVIRRTLVKSYATVGKT